MPSISLVLSKLDYSNSLLCRQPNYLLCKLQALQNHAAKQFFKLIISPLPATVLIVCTGYLSPKDASLNYFGSLHALSSLNNLLILLIFCQSDTRQPLRSLHSGFQLHQPVSSGLFTSRSFSHQAPRLWNSLPSNLRSSPSIMNFHKLLKTHLYHKHPQS